MKASHFAFIVVLTSVVFYGCKHNNIERQLGPSFCSNNDSPFLRNPKDTLDFAKWGDTLSAKISGNLEWHITIKGRNSQAIKRFDSVSTDILRYWKGETDTAAFFTKGEWCDIIFSNNCQPTQVKQTYLKSNPNYNKIGYLIDDFEVKINSNAALPNPIDVFSTSYNGLDSTTFPAVQGKKFLRVASSPKNWYVGDYTVKFIKILQNLGVKDPSQVYLNFFVNNNKVTTNGVQVLLKEAGKDRAYKINAMKDGWNFVSIKLSDIGVVDASKVTTLTFSYGPSLVTSPVDLSLDFIIFTKGKPWIK